MFPERDLISILKQKDAQFVLFCKGLEGKIAQDEDLAFFLSGEQEINEILNEIDLRISVTSDEKEKENLLKEKGSWLKERDAYHKEIQRIQAKMKKKHQMASNGRYFLNDEERNHYARIIYLITIYDEQKQKLKLDGSLSSEELEELIQNLHHIQEKINMYYQAIFKTSDVLEEESVLPRIKNEDESYFQYENYVREFFGLEAKEEEKVSVDDLVSFMDTDEIRIEEDKKPIKPQESALEQTEDKNDLIIEDDYKDSLEEDVSSEELDFDFWLNPDAYQKILNNPWIQKIMETQNESLGYFIQFIQPLSENQDYLEHRIGLLRNSALQIEIELMEKDLFQESKKGFADNFIFYRDELAKRGYEPRKTFLFSTLSALFQAIYLYDKLKENIEQNYNTLLSVRDKINTLSYGVLGIQDLIPRNDLPIKEEETIEPTLDTEGKTIEEEPETSLELPSVVSSESVIEEESISHEVLTPVTEEVENDEKYASLIAKINELENKVNILMEESERQNQKGKPFKVIKKATNRVLFFLNRHKILASAIGSLTVLMLSAGSISLTKHYEPVNPPEIVTEVSMPDMPLHYTVSESDFVPDVEEKEEKSISLEDNGIPHVGTSMHPRLGIVVYPDQYVGLGREGDNGRSVNYSPTTEMKISKLGFMDSTSGIVYSSKSDEESLKYLQSGYKLVSCFDDTYGYFSIDDVTLENRESGLSR